MTNKEIVEVTLYHTSVTTEGQNYFDNNTTITIDKNKNNPRHNDLLNFEPKGTNLGKEVGWLKSLDNLVDLIDKKGLPDNAIELIKEITNYSWKMNNRYWEKIFEEVRLKDFNDLPSRYNCIYLADSANIVQWHTKALNQLDLDELPIYKFRASGTVHYADPEWLEVDIVSDSKFKYVARKYWSGESCPDSKDNLREILFCGKLEVVKKYNNLDEFKRHTKY